MDENQSSSIPIWVWVIGGCAFLSLIAACMVIALAILGVGFFTTTPVVVPPGTSPIVTPIVATDTPPAGSQNSNEALPSSTPVPTVTDSPPQTPTQTAVDPEETADPQTTTEDPFAEIREEIEDNVVEVRGLPQLEEVEPTSLTPAELRVRLETDLNEEYSPEEAREDVLVLNAFDFLERDFDLYNFNIDLLTEQIAGFYDPETNEFVIISGDGNSFGGLEQFTYAHEFVHALQDQHFNLDLLSDEDLEAEAAFALRALVEGDATLAQSLYIANGYFSQEQLFEIIAAAGEIDTTILDSAPPLLASELEFPYVAGLEFVQTLYEQGGYAAVNAAWENLPQSTEQIIHPELYLSGDLPQIVALQPMTDTLGSGWQRLDEDTLGEFYLRQYLVQQLTAEVAGAAAAGWGGDRYAVYWNEESEQVVMVLKLVWDTVADGEEFFAAYEDYPAQLFNADAASQDDDGLCWQGEDVICLYQVGDETLIVRALDLETAAAVSAAQS